MPADPPIDLAEDAEEREAAVLALTYWFASQGLDEGSAQIVMIDLTTKIMATMARNPDHLEKIIRATTSAIRMGARLEYHYQQEGDDDV
jgi:hypothetical protein